MAVEKVLPGLGTLLQLKIASTYTTLPQRVTIEGPEMEVGTRETTHLDSTAKSYAPTIVDGGELTMTIEYDPNGTTHTTLAALILAPPVTAGFSQWQLVFNDSLTTHATYQFNGILTKFKPTGIEVEGNLQAEMTIKVTGLPVFTAGA